MPMQRYSKISRTGAAVDATVLSRVSEDFGHIFHGTPKGVVRPKSKAEVETAVKNAIKGTKLTIRGFGHSGGGQALPSGSVVLDLSGMNRVGPVNRQLMTVRCQGGALLRNVVAATLKQGLVPRTLTNLLDITVGGVLSVGGVGAASHRFGPMVANVSELEVVIGDGSLRRCSRSENAELFEAVLGGLGRCGVIVSADLELRPVRPNVRTFYLLYDDHRKWIDDQSKLAASGQVDSLEASCTASVQGLRGVEGRRATFAQWFFPLQFSIEYETEPPKIPGGLSPYRIVHQEDDRTQYFPFRHDARFAMLRRIGAWERPHPYVTAFVGANSLKRVLPAVLETLPLSLGDGHRAFLVARRNSLSSLALPEQDPIIFFSVMHPQVPPQMMGEALDSLRRVSRILVDAGGKRYLADWLGKMGPADWRRHFGARSDRWVEAKSTFDPHGVFSSLLLP